MSKKQCVPVVSINVSPFEGTWMRMAIFLLNSTSLSCRSPDSWKHAGPVHQDVKRSSGSIHRWRMVSYIGWRQANSRSSPWRMVCKSTNRTGLGATRTWDSPSCSVQRAHSGKHGTVEWPVRETGARATTSKNKDEQRGYKKKYQFLWRILFWPLPPPQRSIAASTLRPIQTKENLQTQFTSAIQTPSVLCSDQLLGSWQCSWLQIWYFLWHLKGAEASC